MNRTTLALRRSFHHGLLGFHASVVGGVACSRGQRSREDRITIRAPEETKIFHQSDAGDARGFTKGTRGYWLQGTVEASLGVGLSHLPPSRSNRPHRDPGCLKFLFQIQECIACRLVSEAGTFTTGTFNGIDQGLDPRQTRGENFGLYRHITAADSSTEARRWRRGTSRVVKRIRR
jgi:hypothetical protein